MRNPTFKDTFILILLAAIWGSAFLAIKITVHEVPPATIAASRLLIATVIIYGYMRSRGLSLPRSKKFWIQIFFVSFFTMAAPFTLISWAEQYIESGLTAILMATGPLLALVLSHFFSTDDRFTLFKLLGVIIGFSGVLLILGFDSFSEFGDDVPAQLATMVAAMCYAGSGLLVKRVREKSNTITTASILLVATLQILPFSLLLDAPWQSLPASSLSTLAALVYLGAIPTALAFILRFYLIREVSYTFVSYVGYLVPVFGVIWGTVFLGERLPAETLLALAMILSGIAVSRLSLGWFLALKNNYKK
ncbi:DMT family transporter [Kiloniella laminariae]|uniref:DMT family transporter n=1 Tax=Kiloniella laminariae TaxID=454162 RepID=UPI00037E72DF|nr:EamA family transporter [Kiloniella laminariae]